MRSSTKVAITLTLIAATALGISIVGCGVDSERTVKTSNPKTEVELLFTNDGCRVYRFMDYGEPVYYADCRTDGSGESTTMNWRHLEGKVTHTLQSTTAR
jgi:hypothetical protein